MDTEDNSSSESDASQVSSTAQVPENPFRPSHSRRARIDFALRIGFCALTYFILLCAAAVFFDITWKGAPVVFPKLFGHDGPLVNTDLFTKDPETLVVFENADADKVAMGFGEFTQYKKDNPDAVVENEHTHSYSAGGVKGPMVGTIFLVTICIGVALFIGIATAVYLNEYSAKGKMVDGIRLAILNLAGVPSIVFGLFGLMFFCFFVPVITATPVDRPGFNPPPIPIPFVDYFISFQGWGTCMLDGGFTLAAMILPAMALKKHVKRRHVARLQTLYQLSLTFHCLQGVTHKILRMRNRPYWRVSVMCVNFFLPKGRRQCYITRRSK